MAKNYQTIVIIAILSIVVSGQDWPCASTHDTLNRSLEFYETICVKKLCECLNRVPEESCKELPNMAEALVLYYMMEAKTDYAELTCYDWFGHGYKTNRFSYAFRILISGFPPYGLVLVRLYRRPEEFKFRSQRSGAKYKVKSKEGKLLIDSLETVGLFDFKVSQEGNGLLNRRLRNIYESSYIVSRREREQFEQLTIGPIGGRDVKFRSYKFKLDYRPNSTDDTILDLDITPISMSFNYRSRPNLFITTLKVDEMILNLCLGRKMDEKTGRTYYTGKGCKPVVFYRETTFPNLRSGFNNEIVCQCEFKPIDLFAAIKDPTFKQIDDFRYQSDKVRETEGSVTTRNAIILSSVMIILCTIALATFGTIFFFCRT